MPLFFDSHCHLQDPAFSDDLLDTIERARAAGVAGITLLGYDPPSNVRALEIAARTDDVYPSVGIHPHDAGSVTAADLAELESLARRPEVVAVGEIGLDFYRDLSPRDRQREVLEEQLAIALRVGKPACVHSRAAEDALTEALGAFGTAWRRSGRTSPAGVMHAFGGTLEQAQRYVDLGFLVSIACTVTYPKNDETRRIAVSLPLSALVVETDSPYLPPQSLRGRRNEPARVSEAASAIARLRGVSLDLVAETTTGNAERLFNVVAAHRVRTGAR